MQRQRTRFSLLLLVLYRIVSWSGNTCLGIPAQCDGQLQSGSGGHRRRTLCENWQVRKYKSIQLFKGTVKPFWMREHTFVWLQIGRHVPKNCKYKHQFYPNSTAVCNELRGANLADFLQSKFSRSNWKVICRIFPPKLARFHTAEIYVIRYNSLFHCIVPNFSA